MQNSRFLHVCNWAHVGCIVFRYLYMGLYMAMEARTPCPESCDCSLLRDGTVSASCRLDNKMDYTAIGELPSNTTRLVCRLSGKLKEDSLELKSLFRLERLAIVPEKHSFYIMAKHDHTISQLSRDDLLQNLSNLESFSVNVPTGSITPRILDPVANLKVLDLSHSGLYHHDNVRDLLQNMTRSGHSLQTLNLTEVQLQYASGTPDTIYVRDIYVSIQDFPIKTLDLMGNEIVALQAGLTAYLPHLEVVRVGAKRLFYIDTDNPHSRACFNMDPLLHPSLRVLDLSYPAIEYHYWKPKRSTPEYNRYQGGRGDIIKCVIVALIHGFQDLTCTFVNCLCQGVIYTPCERIQKINLRDLFDFKTNCYFFFRIPLPPQLDSFSFKNLNFLPLGDNNTIQNYIFRRVPGNSSTVCFSLQNKLRYLDMSSRIVNRGMLRFEQKISLNGLTKLEFVNIQGNSLLLTPTTTLFSDTPLLKVLLLGGNRMDLNSWNHLDFLQLPNLESLDLQSCQIPNIPRDAFSRLDNLRVLNLSDNGIKELAIKLGPNMRRLILSRNDISSLARFMRDYLDKLADDHHVAVDLSLNPLQCFCEELPFVRWMQSTHVRFENEHATFCAHPTSYRIHPWDVDVDALHLQCIQFDAIISSVSGGVVALLLVGVVVLLYRKRWRIRFWIHTARESWRKKHRRDPTGYERLNFTYDAFVAYSTHGAERRWVHTTLREKLEGEHGLRLCLYYRDFKLGVDLADAIVEGINRSSKILLILSPTFLKSGWCDFEVRMAKEKLMTERRDSLVVVIYSKLEEEGMNFPKSLVRLLEKKIYCEWTDDPEGQELFWRRLVEAITSEQEYDAFAGCTANSNSV